MVELAGIPAERYLPKEPAAARSCVSTAAVSSPGAPRHSGGWLRSPQSRRAATRHHGITYRLALAALLRFRAEELPMPAGAVLLWPYADFTFSGESIHTFAEIDMLPVRDLAHLWGPAYVGGADPTDPFVSPALADLRGPPLLVIAGGAESLLSSAELIAANGRAAGFDITLSVYPEKVHGWMMLPHLSATSEATAELIGWIAARLGSPTNDPTSTQ